MVKFIKAITALAVIIIFFGITFLISKDKQGTPNAEAIAAKAFKNYQTAQVQKAQEQMKHLQDETDSAMQEESFDRLPSPSKNARMSSLMIAVATDDLEKAKILLKGIQDPNSEENGTSNTPLFLAIQNNSPQMVQLLLDHNADVDQVNEKGLMPIHIAAGGSRYGKDPKFRANEIINSILEHGGDINRRNAMGQTPLMLACRAGRQETVLFLLQKKASTSIKDMNGNTVWDYAKMAPAEECLNILQKYNKSDDI